MQKPVKHVIIIASLTGYDTSCLFCPCGWFLAALVLCFSCPLGPRRAVSGGLLQTLRSVSKRRRTERHLFGCWPGVSYANDKLTTELQGFVFHVRGRIERFFSFRNLCCDRPYPSNMRHRSAGVGDKRQFDGNILG